MARMTSSSSSSPVPPITQLLTNSAMSSSYNTHKTSPSSTDTACSQDDDDQPLELTSHTHLTVTSNSNSSLPALSISSASQPPLTLAASTLRWTGHGYEICPPASSVLFSAYCDANALMQTGMFNSCRRYSRLFANKREFHCLVLVSEHFPVFFFSICSLGAAG